MPKLTPEGEQIVAGIAQRYGISFDAVKAMLDAVSRGGGTMAQFNVPELGGGGQWMLGGMTMVGDMFNNSLKATVDNLCYELSNLLANQPGVWAPVPQFQSQSQGSAQQQSQGGAQFQNQGGGGSGVSLYVPQSSSSFGWWPAELGNASSTGSQNNLRYAYFPGTNRLAIDFGGRVEVYDTTGYDIGGFGQQQSGDASLTFTSPRGVVRVDSLPRVDSAGAAPKPAPEIFAPEAKPHVAPEAAMPSAAAAGNLDSSSILTLLEQLGALKEKGILTEEEFAAKKSELLKRL
ncbi:MAG: SHOCT domain-containing protein [Rhodomicrobium sp.]